MRGMKNENQPTTSPNTSWRAAWRASPGPQTPGAAFLLAAKGFCMGVADIIPGVSGGTIAFITGIYEQLLAAIGSFDVELLCVLRRGRFRAALAHAHVRFLIVLLSGIVLALVSLAHLMHWLLEHHPSPTWSLFCGLIGASIIVIARQIGHWGKAAPVLAVATVLTYLLVGIIPIETPNDWWFLMLCGTIAICAMILPGISGSFLLLMLGKYEYVTGAVKNPFSSESLGIIAVFLVGAAVGITFFSRLLKWCLANFHNTTMAALMGCMIGGMRKIWPWKETLEQRMIGDKLHDLRTVNILPKEFDGEVMLSIAMAVVGFIAVLVLNRMAGAGNAAEPVDGSGGNCQ